MRAPGPYKTNEDQRPMAEETLKFETEGGKILQIVANSLYSPVASYRI